MPRRRERAAISLPRGVHRVVSRGREYFYFQRGRGSKSVGARISLPNDPHSPEFWIALRQAQGMVESAVSETFGGLLDSYFMHLRTSGEIADATIELYDRVLRVARAAWGNLPSKGIRPVHVQAIMDRLSDTPGKANNFLGAMRGLSSWARVRDYVDHSLTDGVKRYSRSTGHKPWTPAQIEAARTQLTGVVRRGVMLYMWTGMRGSDAVRLGWTDIDEGGLSFRAQKTGREVYCPIVPELVDEMSTWEKRPGPFLLQEEGRAAGKKYTRKLFSKHFAEARDEIPALAGATLHGLRCTAVIRLRRAGLSTAQIGDIVGMSIQMIERYSRFADRKANGKAALLILERTSREQKL